MVMVIVAAKSASLRTDKFGCSYNCQNAERIAGMRETANLPKVAFLQSRTTDGFGVCQDAR